MSPIKLIAAKWRAWEAKASTYPYGQYENFTWEIRYDGEHPVAVIQRDGKPYCNLVLWCGHGHHRQRSVIVEFIQERIWWESKNG